MSGSANIFAGSCLFGERTSLKRPRRRCSTSRKKIKITRILPTGLPPRRIVPLNCGHAIGSVVLSIQDDEGYLRLTRRLAGLDVLMYMKLGSGPPQLVKDSLGPMPGPALAAVPASGAYRYEGRSFRVFTVHAKAFPSGPLTVRVLVPMPYL